jgi:hypothetical protein
MKVGLSNYQYVCVCSPVVTVNRLVDFHVVWYGGNAIREDLDTIIFNPIASMILRLLRFRIVK